MRGLFFLVVIAIVLVAAGVIGIHWNNNGSATIDFHQDVARERANQVIKEAEVLEANLKAKLDQAAPGQQ